MPWQGCAANLDAQISWQAQDFVKLLQVQISALPKYEVQPVATSKCRLCGRGRLCQPRSAGRRSFCERHSQKPQSPDVVARYLMFLKTDRKSARHRRCRYCYPSDTALFTSCVLAPVETDRPRQTNAQFPCGRFRPRSGVNMCFHIMRVSMYAVSPCLTCVF